VSNGWLLTGNATAASNFLGTTNNQPLSVRTNGTERLRVAANGNVGVGLTGPATKLHVSGGRIRLESSGKRLDLRADGGAVDVQSETHNLFLHSSGPSGRNHIIMNPFGNEGNVGIGTQAPTAKLEVAGNIRANDVVLNSDARLKTDITPIGDATDRLSRIRGVQFTRVDPACAAEPRRANRSAGVIAQEVEAVFPEIVESSSTGDYKGVNYGGLTALLIEAFKEMQEENRSLRRRIELLEARLG
jgi:hypothetical protein